MYDAVEGAATFQSLNFCSFRNAGTCSVAACPLRNDPLSLSS